MSNAVERQSFTVVVDLANLDSGLTELMRRISGHKSGRRLKSLLPTLVGLEVSRNNRPGEDCQLRQFVKSLRSLHQKHFVRFVTPYLWMAESDNKDLFYATDKNVRYSADVCWRIAVPTDGLIRVEVDMLSETEEQQIARKLCRSLTPSFDALDLPTHVNYLTGMLERFYRTVEFVPEITKTDMNLHIVFIPDGVKRTFYPIPLVGISLEDARRKYEMFRENMMIAQDVLYCEFMPRETTLPAILNLIIESIQDHEASGYMAYSATDRKKAHRPLGRRYTAPVTYGHAELLLGWFTMHACPTQDMTNHEFLVFDRLYDKDGSVNVVRESMDHIGKR